MIAGIAHLNDKQKSLMREIDNETAVKKRLEAELGWSFSLCGNRLELLLILTLSL